MILDWQSAIVTACVAWAAASVVRRGYQTLLNPSSSGCGTGHCGNCPANSSHTPAMGLIQLDLSSIQKK